MSADVVDSPDRSVAQHVHRYLATDGRDGYLEGGVANLVLTVTGRTSGRRHRTALFYGADGDRYVLVASGSAVTATDPSWYRNLVANPVVEVQIKGERFTATARTAEGAESSYLESTRELAGAVGDADPSLHLYATSEFFAGPLPAEAVDALIARFGSGPAEREIGFMPWGGGDHDVAPDATAFPHRRARYVIHHIAVAPDPSPDARAWVRGMCDALHPYGTGGVYANFADPGLADWERAYYGDNAARLRDVRRRYDPDGVFRTAQSVR